MQRDGVIHAFMVDGEAMNHPRGAVNLKLVCERRSVAVRGRVENNKGVRDVSIFWCVQRIFCLHGDLTHTYRPHNKTTKIKHF